VAIFSFFSSREGKEICYIQGRRGKREAYSKTRGVLECVETRNKEQRAKRHRATSDPQTGKKEGVWEDKCNKESDAK
jgi:hypothetical protein